MQSVCPHSWFSILLEIEQPGFSRWLWCGHDYFSTLLFRFVFHFQTSVSSFGVLYFNPWMEQFFCRKPQVLFHFCFHPLCFLFCFNPVVLGLCFCCQFWWLHGMCFSGCFFHFVVHLGWLHDVRLWGCWISKFLYVKGEKRSDKCKACYEYEEREAIYQ